MPVRVTWRNKLRAMSLEHRYLLEDLPDPTVPVPPHPLWQSPFVFAPPDEAPDKLTARVRLGGELWLYNYDFRPFNELIIAHAEWPWFMAFQRAQRPDEGHIFIGPIERRVLRPSDGQQLWRLPLVFRETEKASSRELWRQLAGARK